MKSIVTVFDIKAGYYFDPKIVPNKGEALRAFMNEVNTVGSNFNKYATDYVLYEFGSFDEQTGKFALLDIPYPLCRAIDVYKDPDDRAAEVAAVSSEFGITR